MRSLGKGTSPGEYFRTGQWKGGQARHSAVTAGTRHRTHNASCSGAGAGGKEEKIDELSAADVAKRDENLAGWGARYFEKQLDMKCGERPVNNIMGGPQFTEGTHGFAHGTQWLVFTLGLATLFNMTSPCFHRSSIQPVEANWNQSMPE